MAHQTNPYTRYLNYCERIGVQPMPEVLWLLLDCGFCPWSRAHDIQRWATRKYKSAPVILPSLTRPKRARRIRKYQDFDPTRPKLLRAVRYSNNFGRAAAPRRALQDAPLKPYVVNKHGQPPQLPPPHNNAPVVDADSIVQRWLAEGIGQ